MVKVQIDLTESENQKIELYKTSNSFETKAQAIKELIKIAPLEFVLFECKNCKHNFYSSFIWNEGNKKNKLLSCPNCKSERVSIKK